MSLFISSLTASSALSAFHRSDRAMQDSLARLASGRRINRGADNPAGLIAAEALSAQITALAAEQESSERLYAFANRVEGDLEQVSEVASQLRARLVQAANSAGLSDAEKAAIQVEIDSLVESAGRSAESSLQALQRMNLPDDVVGDLSARLANGISELRSLASGGSQDLSSGAIERAADTVESVVSANAELRGAIGAYQRYVLDTQIRSSQIAEAALIESRSRIRDTEFALETATLSREQVRRAAAVEVLRIARALPGRTLDLVLRAASTFTSR